MLPSFSILIDVWMEQILEVTEYRHYKASNEDYQLTTNLMITQFRHFYKIS
jgi:hypothetical protein